MDEISKKDTQLANCTSSLLGILTSPVLRIIAHVLMTQLISRNAFMAFINVPIDKKKTAKKASETNHIFKVF